MRRVISAIVVMVLALSVVQLAGAAPPSQAAPGDGLLDIVVDYVAANSPIDPAVEGRIAGP